VAYTAYYVLLPGAAGFLAWLLPTAAHQQPHKDMTKKTAAEGEASGGCGIIS